MRQKYAFVHTLIIDEVSMVSAETLNSIHDRLCAIADSDEVFGNFNIILYGDFFQLRPVSGYFAVENHMLWKYFQSFILRKNMRQSPDFTFTSLLNRIRLGVLNEHDVSLLKSLVDKKELPHSLKNSDCLHLFPKLDRVKALNEAIQSCLEEADVTIEATHILLQMI